MAPEILQEPSSLQEYRLCLKIENEFLKKITEKLEFYKEAIESKRTWKELFFLLILTRLLIIKLYID